MQKALVKALPKIELHCHLDGSVRPHILEKIAQEELIPLPYKGQLLAEKLIAPEDCPSLSIYLEKFDLVLPFLQTEFALELIAYDLIAQVAEENVTYIEVRFAPLLFNQKGLNLTQIITAVLKGLARGKKEFGVQSNALLCGMRHHTIADNKQVVQAVSDFSQNGVVGFDLAGDEANYPTENFSDVLNFAKEAKLPLTLHAGECGCPHNVMTSIKLGATRIGHGIAIQKDETVIKTCLENQTVIEMCPTSNFQTKAVTHLADYPFKKFLDAGLKICINTDNRTVSNTTLTEEYLKLEAWYGIDYACLEKLNHHAIDGAFIDSKQKEILHSIITHGYSTSIKKTIS
ncbi:adenosine deaminase [Vagococcus intermedius]|uniref:adenosine deaminase n=1 Tax=Vagococcus intermedius TaxID=2991418 RepID=A0AAF0CV54_9ENTE|nr:adenosine deaminase [Vagococcus intermedius]WEG73446.1 adenosine deaminase [Vagococcus intermedius]WEG75529.1 adenosine deaminase [Vagococcus intermedius]